MDRKTFIRKTSVGILIGIPTMTLLSCSSSDNDSSPSPGTDDDQGSSDPNCLENGTDTSISANHGHSLSVSKDDVAAATEKSYTLSEGNGHTHEVTISKSQFETLQGNTQITATSTSDSGHTHNVTVSCLA
ncbi:hypothetical protein LB467_16855 [Salegentibacter sp. JZCK2]|uniref:hypothetical protein n=1 Tax=Salegentibacter tibetensis TaxID=2873600 RepID=UPI001CCF1940|nr:hypothetical protein [Salegentibacter tibetensis]MBZ9731361.1 hypothetical protein [Salegentibacter tibetensis]